LFANPIMKKYLLSAGLFVVSVCAFGQALKTAAPHLEKQGTATRLIVNDKPYLMIAGELHNSSTSNAAYMRPIWKQMADKHLNTVIAAASWELVEPQQGKFDFTLVDSMVLGARKQGLHLVMIWFASWKNGTSTYAPVWVKNNADKYTYAKDAKGKTLETLSTFGNATMQADANAFKQLMLHIKQIDEKYQTVIMMQVENESGLLRADRDHSDAANKAFDSPIPADLAKYLTGNKSSLAPELYDIWKENGFKTTGNWETVFGKSDVKEKDWQHLSYYTEELFMAYHYARYIGTVAAAGKSAYNIPMYVNAWLKQPDTPIPGRYPGGGSLPQVIDMYRSAGPALDFIAPDIYIPQFTWVLSQFHRLGNPLMIPETKGGVLGAARAFFAYGEHDAMCFSPFGIDGDYFNDEPLSNAYLVIDQLKELILKNQGKQTMRGILVDTASKIQEFDFGSYHIAANINDKSAAAGGIMIQTGPDEFIVASKSMNIIFSNKSAADPSHVAFEAIDEGTFKNGRWIAGRRLNGDEQLNAVFEGTGLKFAGKGYTIQHVKLYRFK